MDLQLFCTPGPRSSGLDNFADFERGFIEANVAAFDDFKALHGGQASMAKVKEAGKYRQEGKQYVMQDSDIIVFMDNVMTAAKKKYQMRTLDGLKQGCLFIT